MAQAGQRIRRLHLYADLGVTTDGFGLGVERTVAWITREKHIRQCIPFPRMMDKVYI